MERSPRLLLETLNRARPAFATAPATGEELTIASLPMDLRAAQNFTRTATALIAGDRRGLVSAWIAAREAATNLRWKGRPMPVTMASRLRLALFFLPRR